MTISSIQLLLYTVYKYVLRSVISSYDTLHYLLQLRHLHLQHLYRQPSEESVLLGDTANFRCIVTGEPQPYISWMRNGRALDGEVSPYLIIPSVGTANRGFYTCQATNREGTITSEQALLRIQSKPGNRFLLSHTGLFLYFCACFCRIVSCFTNCL